MYLWYVLNSHGFSPTKPGSKGPDYCFRSGKETTWVEAVTPGRGEGQDAVPRLRFLNDMLETGEKPIAQDVPEEAILLRFTHALDEKRKKYEEFRSEHIAKSTDPFIIAINGCVATDYRGDPPVPYVIKATIGLGHLMVSFDPRGKEPPSSSYQRREQVLKRNQEPIPTNVFLREEYRGISGVLYSPKDICNIPEKVGSEMYYFHNPQAKNPLSFGLFKFCREYWVDLEGGVLKHKDWHVQNPS
jgi:type I restriction enzyme S subunit